MHDILKHLNEKQREAVTLPEQHALILAGAGSGKTRVLVHRLAFLMQQYHLAPNQILAVTFTNKAAHEMRERIENLFGISTLGMWVGTFHGLSHRLLRLHYQQANLPESFQILDSDDQYRLIRRVLKTLNLDEQYWPPKPIQHFINEQKDAIKRSHQIDGYQDLQLATWIKIYQTYEQLCQQNGLVDFAELLLRSFELLRDNLDVREHYQSRFRHLLIDEFQDTNHLQYAWVKLLAGKNNYVMAVGDDDQSIYGWRGAKIENLHRLQKDFAPIAIIRLEQNYRSTKTILKAANAVIDLNTDRLGKTLWTAGEDGTPIQLYAGFNELDEARFIVSRIQQHLTQGARRQDVAILYRSNAQSRVIEEALLQANIPYRVYGGQRFFERAEIKDAMAYLRLIGNPHDDGAFERIINVPVRGIGERSVDLIRDTARAHHCSLWQAAQTLIEQKALPPKATGSVSGFFYLFEQIKTATTESTLEYTVDQTLRLSQLADHYRKEPHEKAQTRLDNLAELVTAAKQFVPEETIANSTPYLSAFLAHAALESGEGQAPEFQDSVQLMTLHSAKGLEFPIVFMSGMEEELFPPRLSVDDPKRLSEERRLCYVGITRAMQYLTLTYAEYRRLYGENKPHRPSRFIREIPKDCLTEVRLKSSVLQPNHTAAFLPKRTNTMANGTTHQGKTWFVGQPIRHPKFGEGVIVNYEGQNDHARLQIRFSNGDMKWLLPEFIQVNEE